MTTTTGPRAMTTTPTHWGRDVDPDALALIETRMWKAYYRRQPARLFGLLVEALRAQAQVGWPRALAASLLLTRAAAGFARATGDYERFARDIGRAYRLLGLPSSVDAEAVARTTDSRELYGGPGTSVRLEGSRQAADRLR